LSEASINLAGGTMEKKMLQPDRPCLLMQEVPFGIGSTPGRGNDSAFVLSIFKAVSAQVFDRQPGRQASGSVSRL